MDRTPRILLSVVAVAIAFASGWLVGACSEVEPSAPTQVEHPAEPAGPELLAVEPHERSRPESVGHEPAAPRNATNVPLQSVVEESHHDVRDGQPSGRTDPVELTRHLSGEQRASVLAELSARAQSLATTCYVTLREERIAALARDLDGAKQALAHAAIARLVDAEYHWRLAQNQYIEDRVLGRSDPRRVAGRGGGFMGVTSEVQAGEFTFQYVINLDERPDLATARQRREKARDALAPFLRR